MNPHNIVVDSGAEIIVHGNFFYTMGGHSSYFLNVFMTLQPRSFPVVLNQEKGICTFL